MSDHPAHDDDAVLEQLRRVLELAEPAPPFIAAAGAAAYSWRRIDTELAELLSDTADAEEQLAGTARSSAPRRTLRFSGAGVSIELEVQIAEDRITLLGQLSPPAATEIELEAAGGEASQPIRSTELGLFRFELAGARQLRLRLRAPGDGAAAWVASSWFAV